MYILENKDMLCVIRYKSNWDSDFTGVSFSEAPPYLLLWHFIENKNSKKTLFMCVLKMLETKYTIVFEDCFLVYSLVNQLVLKKLHKNALKPCSKKT